MSSASVPVSTSSTISTASTTSRCSPVLPACVATRVGGPQLRALDRLGLGHLTHRRPTSLSGGERQRVALAAALAHGPGLVIADDPTGELDATSADQVYDFLREHAERTGAASAGGDSRRPSRTRRNPSADHPRRPAQRRDARPAAPRWWSTVADGYGCPISFAPMRGLLAAPLP